MVINKEVTIRWKGYDPADLKIKSGKKVWANCDKCGRGRWVTRQQYTDLCQTCSNGKRKGKPRPQEVKDKIRNTLMGHGVTEETLEKMSKGQLEYYKNNPTAGQERGDKNKQRYIDQPELRDDCSERYLKYNIDHPEKGKKHSIFMKELFKNPDRIEFHSKNQKRILNNNLTREKMRSSANNRWGDEDERERASQRTKQLLIDNPEILERRSANLQGQDYNAGEWTGFLQNERNVPEYMEWRNTVYKRDDYTCQQCKQHGGTLNAHHIYMWSKYPELRFDIDNGITLCETCHKAVRGYEDKYINMFIMLMN